MKHLLTVKFPKSVTSTFQMFPSISFSISFKVKMILYGFGCELKGQYDEMVDEMSPWSSSLGRAPIFLFKNRP
jgi:hypothetical protein